jgi:hypothetical protein
MQTNFLLWDPTLISLDSNISSFTDVHVLVIRFLRVLRTQCFCGRLSNNLNTSVILLWEIMDFILSWPNQIVRLVRRNSKPTIYWRTFTTLSKSCQTVNTILSTIINKNKQNQQFTLTSQNTKETRTDVDYWIVVVIVIIW